MLNKGVGYLLALLVGTVMSMMGYWITSKDSTERGHESRISALEREYGMIDAKLDFVIEKITRK